jgi:UDP-glucuronate 4-epimerase
MYVKPLAKILLTGLIVRSTIYFFSKENHDLPDSREVTLPDSREVTVLVTGAAGFVGHHVMMRLLNAIGVDNFNMYYDVSLKRRRAALSGRVLEYDVCDGVKLRETLMKYDIKHVIHLAAQAGVRYSLKNPHSYVKNNVQCFVQLLEVLKNLDIPLIYASSSSVYGKNTKVPFSEEDAVVQPASLYAATKRENELLAHVYHNLYKQRSIGLRFFTVYGPLGRPDMAYYSFTKNIMEGKPIEVYNYGKVSRDFTYIDDIVDGIVGCLGIRYEQEILNLGRGQPFSVGAFIKTIEEATKKVAIKKMMPMASGDVLTTYANISKAKRLIGYNPKVLLQDGIDKFVEWYKEYY